jgi:hypothetical protein
MNDIYEPLPKYDDPNCWVAPEHRRIAVSMRRDKNRDLIIELPDILKKVEVVSTNQDPNPSAS